MLLLFEYVEARVNQVTTDIENNNWIVFSTYIAITYVLSLRGSEGLMLESSGLRKYWKSNQANYFDVVLYGKLKGEDTYREHIIPCINVIK